MTGKFRVRDQRDKGWFFVDNELVSVWGDALGAYGIAIYAVLAMYANNKTQETFPSYNTIARTIKCSRRKVIDIMKLLEVFNIIEKTERKGDDGVFDSNIIKLVNKEFWIKPSDLAAPDEGNGQSLHAVVNEVHHMVNEVHYPKNGEQDAPGSESGALVNEIHGGSESGAPKLDSCNYTESNINTRACVPVHEKPQLDPLSHALALQATHDPQASEPSDFEMYFGSRDEFIKTYVNAVGSYPNPIVKDEIIRIAQLPGADPAAWERAIRETFLNYTGQSPPPIRFIEVYEHGGGDYRKFTEWKIKNGDWQNTNGNGGKNGQARTGKGKSTVNGASQGQQNESLTDAYLRENADHLKRGFDALRRV